MLDISKSAFHSYYSQAEYQMQKRMHITISIRLLAFNYILTLLYHFNYRYIDVTDFSFLRHTTVIV